MWRNDWARHLENWREAMLESHGLTKRFGQHSVLAGVDLTIKPGELVGIIGSSGAGKSTIARILAGLLVPDSGQLTLDNADLANSSTDLMSDRLIKYRRETVGYVSQDVQLFPWMSVQDQMLLAPARHRSSLQTETTQKLLELSSKLDCDGLLARTPEVLSGGESRRFGLIRALLLNPQYLVLDEITNGLDPRLVVKISDLLIEYVKTRNVGMLAVSHQIDFLRRNADRIVFLQNGQIREEGTCEIINAPKTSELDEFLSFVRRSS